MTMEQQLAALGQAFMQYAADVDTAEMVGIEACCILVQRDAVLLAPIDKGMLRKSIKYRVQKVGLKNTVIGKVGTNAEHGPWVEFGTGIHITGGRQGGWNYQDENGKWHFTMGMRPQPFLTPALNKNKKLIGQIMANAIKKIKVKKAKTK